MGYRFVPFSYLLAFTSHRRMPGAMTLRKNPVAAKSGKKGANTSRKPILTDISPRITGDHARKKLQKKQGATSTKNNTCAIVGCVRVRTRSPKRKAIGGKIHNGMSCRQCVRMASPTIARRVSGLPLNGSEACTTWLSADRADDRPDG